MPNEIAKVVVNWTGFPGAPGYTNFFFNDFTDGSITQAIVDGALARTDTFISNWESSLPTAVKIQVQSAVQIIDVATGKLTRMMSGPAKTLRSGSGTGNYSAASGMCFNWYTAGIRNGRRVRGRTFVVPIAGNALAPDGSIDDLKVTGLRTAAAAFFAPGANQGLPGVYARPTTKGGTDGAWFGTTAFTLPDKAAVLRSRRD